MDYQGTLTMAVMLALYFAISLLYVRKTKHPSLSLWKSLAWCFLLLVWFPFAAGYVLAGLAAFASFALGPIFPYASTAAVKATVTILAVFLSLPAFYLGWKSIQKPDGRKNRMKAVVHGESFATN